jgi:putative ABC transport system permease protein
MDIRYALRSLARHKTFSLVIILTLALGIGSNTVIFSIVNGVLLKTLPYADPDHLFAIQENIPSLERVAPVLPVSANHFVTWRKECTQCAGMAALLPISLNLTGDGAPERISGARVSASYLSLLGVRPALGRNFTEEEDRPGSDHVVIVSHDLWRRRFNGDPAIVGKTIRLDNISYQVVGVLPADFVPPKGYELNPIIPFGPRTDIWKPMAFTADEVRSPFGNFNFAVVVRGKSNASQVQVSSELNAIQARIAAAIPDEKERTEMRLFVLPMQSVAVARSRASLLLLMAAVGAVLLIVCANIANLLLAHATGRRKELAVRAALGAVRSRLLRQMLVENLIIAFSGALAGLVGAIAGLRFILAHAPGDLPHLESIRIDFRVLLFTAAVSIAASFLFGFVPAWRASRSDPQDGLRGGRGQTENRASGRLRATLVVAEVGMSVALLVAAGLLLGSFSRTLKIDKGFEAENGLSVDLSFSAGKYTKEEQRPAFVAQVLEQLKAIPGVTGVGVVNALPLSGHTEVNEMVPDGMTPSVADVPVADYRNVNGEYFQTIGIPLQQGRSFEDSDRNRKVVIVSARTAAKLWPGESALGKRIRMNMNDKEAHEVIGVVGDVHVASLQESDVQQTLMGYIPYWDRPNRGITLVIRTPMRPEALAASVRNTIWRIDPDMPVPDFKTLTELVSESFASQQFQLVLVLVFAGSAILLACAGIYGVVAYSVAQKRNEIGIRMALGATNWDVGRLVLRDGLIPVVLGLLVGIGGALAAGRLMSGLLFGISATDPLTFAVVCGLVLASGIVACYVPARTAMSVGPAMVLKD